MTIDAAKTGLQDPDPTEERGRAADSLTACLVFVSRHFGRSVSNAAVIHGLPVVDGRLTLPLVDRAAQNCGLSAALLRRAIADIPEQALPAILALENGIFAVLTAIDRDKRRMTLVLPSSRSAPLTVPIVEAEKLYSGVAIFLKESASARSRMAGVDNHDRPHWFWSTVATFRREYIQIAVAAFTINILALASPLFIMNVYDRVIPNFAVSTLWAMAVGVFIALVFDGVLKVIRNQILTIAGKQADYVLASKIFAHVMAIRLDQRPQSSGAFANQVREFEAVREFFTSSSLVAIIDLVFIGIFLFVLYILVGTLALVPILAVPLVILVNLLVQRPLGQAISSAEKESAIRHSVLIEGISNLDTIRALNAEGRLQALWERSVAASSSSVLVGRLWAMVAQTSTGFIQAMVSIVIIAWGVYLVKAGDASVGALVAAMILSGRVLAPLGSVSATLARLKQTVLAFKTIDAIMAMEVERPPDHAFVNRTIGQGTIEFKAVTFRYPDAVDDALREVSFKIAGGERVGIIGRVGSGKTTIGRLLVNLHRPQSGAILVDGIDTRQYDPVDLRAGIGFVSQDNVLFTGTVRENIAIGRPYADDSEIIDAARIAGVEDFVARHPLGYDLPVGEGGRLLSGGQRQSI
ncbi:MAG: type I secretion system permease/ATPase, partial [Hyphomicrobiales bacterium]|nr:type I secretion system permease/ATPase [Hyphomicrobiales bacterium]